STSRKQRERAHRISISRQGEDGLAFSVHNFTFLSKLFRRFLTLSQEKQRLVSWHCRCSVSSWKLRGAVMSQPELEFEFDPPDFLRDAAKSPRATKTLTIFDRKRV